MTQPAQPSQAAPQAAPAAPQGQPAQQPPSQLPAQPAPQYTQPQAWPAYVPQAQPQQQPAAPQQGWPQPPAQGQPPAQQAQPAPQQYPAQPYQVPALPAYPPMPPAEGDDGQGYDLARLPRAAREEIERLRGQAQQHVVQMRTAAISQQAYLVAPQLGVNPQALTGSTAWQQAAAGLDPAAPDYQQRLAWTIQAIAQANPWMAAMPGAQPQLQPPAPGVPGAPPAPVPPIPGAPTAPPAPARSGGEFTGAPGGTPAEPAAGMGRLRNAYGS
ncbi:hypothetical protein ACQEVZ_20250 [Dactylosporangium sp. CA-152071]|uniref:hypothetical protein n=1 Tax=Dactylosporangium sp. CA-152071 TaxID=3239933 RepID=UPI003D90C505